jgi:hypothetical protein
VLIAIVVLERRSAYCHLRQGRPFRTVPRSPIRSARPARSGRSGRLFLSHRRPRLSLLGRPAARVVGALGTSGAIGACRNSLSILGLGLASGSGLSGRYPIRVLVRGRTFARIRLVSSSGSRLTITANRFSACILGATCLSEDFLFISDDYGFYLDSGGFYESPRRQCAACRSAAVTAELLVSRSAYHPSKSQETDVSPGRLRKTPDEHRFKVSRER